MAASPKSNAAEPAQTGVDGRPGGGLSRAMFVSFHRGGGPAGAGELVSRNLAAVLRRVLGDGSTEIYHDSPAGRIEWDGLDVTIGRRSSAVMAGRLLAGLPDGRLSLSWTGRSTGPERRRRLLLVDGVRFSSMLARAQPHFGTTFLLHHNFEPHYCRDASSGLAGRLLERAAAAATRRAFRFATLNLFLTRQDMEMGVQYCRTTPDRAAVLGVFEPVAPLPARVEERTDRIRVLVTGDLSMRKGSFGLAEFLGRVRAARDRLEKRCRFVVAGRNPAPAILEFAAPPFVEIVPNPPSIPELAARADVYMNPNFTGSGIKIRNFDGLRHGLPVLCRVENAAGFDSLHAPAFRTFASSDEGLQLLLELDPAELRSPETRSVVWRSYADTFSLDRGVAVLQRLLAGAAMSR